MLRKAPPLVANSDLNTHCLQAAAKMITSHHGIYEDKNLAFFDDYTGKPKDKAYTWPYRLLVNLIEDGFSVVLHDILDLSSFSNKPFEAMAELYGDSIAQDQVENSEIEVVVEDAKKLLSSKSANLRFSTPDQNDLRDYIKKGCICILNVNGKLLMKKDGYSGHFIVVYDFDDDGFLCHNPGLPPERSRYLSNEELDSVWAYGGEDSKNIMAIS